MAADDSRSCPAPLIAAARLVGFGGSYLPIGLFIGACALVSLVAMAFTKEGAGKVLDA